MLQQLISGLEAGSWYALIGMAVVVIMKATDVPNFSMAEMGLVAAYVSWGLLDKLDHSGVKAFKVGILAFVVATLAGLIVAFALGAIIERVLMRRFGGLSHFPMLLMTIGLTGVIRSVIDKVWGGDDRANPAPWSGRIWRVGDTIISVNQLITIGVGLAAAILLGRFFQSSFGAQMRAVAENRAVARTLGINVGRVAVVAWGIATVVAALAMILQTQKTNLGQGNADALIIRGFVAATIGGFSSLMGAFIGGLMVGVLEFLAAEYISTDWKSAVALLLVFVFLLFKPTGLFAPAIKPREV
ncbi:MAG: branched-chain amino acid ABC transporter permease [Acidimicrobiales bacterium]